MELSVHGLRSRLTWGFFSQVWSTVRVFTYTHLRLSDLQWPREHQQHLNFFITGCYFQVSFTLIVNCDMFKI